MDTTLGSKSTTAHFLPSLSLALASCYQVEDLPDPGGPMMNTQCLIANNSCNYTTLRMNSSSGYNPDSTHTFLMMSSNLKSLFLSTSMPGNKSPSNPKKMSMSSNTILGMLKSLKALINKAASDNSGSALLNPPATTSTDLMALIPQS